MPAPAPAAASGSCDALVASGVRAAQGGDLPSADRALSAAVAACRGSAALRELAGVRFLQRQWPEAEALSAAATRADPSDAHAWRLFGASRFLQGDTRGALDAWNAAGEPRVDVVRVDGLVRTRHRTVERQIGVAAGTVLTSSVLGRARRRLAELPAARSTRLTFAPAGNGQVEMRAAVAEEDAFPRGLAAAAALGLSAAASRSVRVPFAGLTGGGERITAEWRFWPGRPRYGVELAAPVASGAVVTIHAAAERQPFTDPAVPEADRAGGLLTRADWASENVRWTLGGGADRWNGGGVLARATGELHVAAAAPLMLRARVDGWSGSSRRFASAHLRGGWRAALEHGFELWTRAGAELTTADAPLDLWPAGDTGHVRDTLLRAHPALSQGRLRVDRLGRAVLSGTVEARRWWRLPAAARLGAALFVDAARTARRRSGPALADADVGIGARIRLPGAPGTLRIDAARGVHDRRRAFSLAWSLEEP